MTGTAYTLLTNKDGSFAVDLVHNLTLSSQPITPELRRLAENDPKWKRHNHGHNQGRIQSGTGGGGLGFVSAGGGFASGTLSNPSVYGGGSVPQRVAATSSMLAQSSREQGQGQEMQFSTGVLKAYDRSAFGTTPMTPSSSTGYGAGGSGFGSLQQSSSASIPSGGRGKHLTQPAWMTNSSASSASGVANTDTNEQVKKKSRFSEAILPGFVKSSTTLLGAVTPSTQSIVPPAPVAASGAVTESTAGGEGEPAPRVRKSRWDT